MDNTTKEPSRHFGPSRRGSGTAEAISPSPARSPLAASALRASEVTCPGKLGASLPNRKESHGPKTIDNSHLSSITVTQEYLAPLDHPSSTGRAGPFTHPSAAPGSPRR